MNPPNDFPPSLGEKNNRTAQSNTDKSKPVT